MFRRKSLFTVLLALIVSLSILPIFKLDTHAATVNASTLAELQQAINDAPPATEIVLTADIPLTATVTVPSGKDITLSGGFTLTRTNSAIAFDIKEGASLTWQDIILDGNAQDTNYKSAVINNQGKLTINGGEIKNVRSNSPMVGIVTAKGPNAVLTMNGGSIHDNYMSNQFTNVVKITEGASFFMNGGDISNNTLDYSGSNGLNSAVGVEGIKGTSTMEMIGGTITGNTGEYGGILVGTYSTNYTMQNNFSNPAHYYSKGILNLKGGTISNNTAAVLGGGIAVNGTGILTMDGGTISGNKAPFGGGIGVVDYLTSADGKRFGEARWRGFFPAAVTINDGLITGNEATMTAVTSQITDPNAENGVGGGLYVASKEVYVNGGQFTNNTAGKQGGGIYVASVPYVLKMGKTLVTENTATKIGGGMWLCPTGSATTAVTNGASFFDNKAGNGAENNDTGSAGDDVASINKQDPATQTLILSNNGLDNWLVHWYEDGKIDEAYLGNSDGSPRYPNTVNPVVERGTLDGITDKIALKAIVSDEGKAAARNVAKVIVTGNTAPRGGGIGSNGAVVFGRDPVNYDKVDLTVSKKWENSNTNHVTSVTVGLFRITKADFDAVTLTNTDGSMLDTTGMSESEIFQAKVDKLMTSGAATYAQIDQVVLNEANDWKFMFVDLIKYDMVNDAQDTTNPNIYFAREMDTDGNWVANDSKAKFGTQKIKASYKVTKNSSGAYDQVITNEEVKFREIEITKKWVGGSANQVEVQLYKDGVVEGTPVTLNAANNWTTTFTNLPVRDAGRTVDNLYEVREVGETGNIITIDGAKYQVTYGLIDANGKMEITNKKEPEPTPSVETGDSSNLPLFGTILMMSLLVTACVAKKRASILG
ncbi:Cna B-type domain-containing protein [Solobacterium sp.]|uniref:Cna B-type domain-containing protein n=1 Tax=Solobacterium sp. TaxID=2060878 RepID=UPI001CB0E894|nr:Cna B-type domain-containing protein [Solobacterium sp.]MBF1099986.1 Cna B-type domain-containing protein [Solobacterium sp.]